jgi:hypothetical protein
VEGKKFNLGVGAHPAFNFQTRKIIDPSTLALSEITQARRFIAAEINPGYQVTKNFRVGMYYLKGFGLQKDAIRSSHFLTFNTTFSNIKLGGGTSLQFTPQVYYLKLDKEDGIFYTHTMSISKKKMFPSCCSRLSTRTSKRILQEEIGCNGTSPYSIASIESMVGILVKTSIE